MARIVITGSSAGLGKLTAQALIAKGHQVVVHARNQARADQALREIHGAEAAVIADLADVEATKGLATELNEMGTIDVVVHNAGVYQVPAQQQFAVNTLAPYILTSMLHRPERLIYLSSGMHQHGSAKPDAFRSNVGRISYSDTKLHVLMLCKAVARKWASVYANTVNPGWVPTKMGGAGAPDDLQKGYETQVWLAEGKDERVNVTGRYFFHQKEQGYNKAADIVSEQERFLTLCEEMTGVPLIV